MKASKQSLPFYYTFLLNSAVPRSPIIRVIARCDHADKVRGLIIYPSAAGGVDPCVVATLQPRARPRVVEDTFHLWDQLWAVTVGGRDDESLGGQPLLSILLNYFSVYSVYNWSSAVKFLVIFAFYSRNNIKTDEYCQFISKNHLASMIQGLCMQLLATSLPFTILCPEYFISFFSSHSSCDC